MSEMISFVIDCKFAIARCVYNPIWGICAAAAVCCVIGVDDRYVSFQIKLVMFSRDTIVISAVSATIGFLTCLLVVNTQDKQTVDLSLLGFSETNTPNSEEEDKNQLDNSASPPLHCDQGDDLLNLLSR